MRAFQAGWREYVLSAPKLFRSTGDLVSRNKRWASAGEVAVVGEELVNGR